MSACPDPNNVLPSKCATCPFREGSPYAKLAGYLTGSALFESNRICHSTGQSAIYGATGKPERLCRGARDKQLAFFHSKGVIDEPTDKAWADKCREFGITK